MRIKQEIPKAQKAIIVAALEVLQKAAPLFNDENYLNFDITVLKSLMKYDISVEMSKEAHDNFTHNEGVDFPEYR